MSLSYCEIIGMSFHFSMLEKLLLALAAIIGVFLVYIAFLPPEYTVERSINITTPISQVFSEVNDFRRWDAWSPWAKIDPNAKTTFSWPSSGEGAVFGWEGNKDIGKGTMRIVESRPNELISFSSEFVEPFAGKSETQFTFKPADQIGNQTHVTWSMSGSNNFLMRIFCFVFDGKGMIGQDMEKGLEQLKAVAQSR